MNIRSTLRPILLSLALGAAAAATSAGTEPPTLAPAGAHAETATLDAVPEARIPDTALVRDAAAATRDAEGELVFQHSVRVYYWAALAGSRKGLAFDPELLFVAAMFHDYGLTASYADSHLRYEVDGANAARDFLRSHGRPEADARAVWLAIALHTTNGISRHVDPLAQLLAEGANMDLVGAGFGDFTAAQRQAVEAAHPRPPRFPDDFLQALYDNLKHRPETTQGTGLADVLAFKDPAFRRRDFAGLMRQSPWTGAN
ncbi:HD domain-containing protein [Ramlibacter sp. AN1133]|uniref:HD domain-containing protein n=1 Tax=Ramlibacter sp. AN1133 TaxID=3133429 RepID=UPI0030C13664